MHSSLWFAAFVVALTSPEHARSQTPTPSESRRPAFTMRITLREPVVKPGAEVTLNVELLNSTDKEIQVVALPHPYTVDVRDEAGESAPMTPRGRRVLKKERITENGRTRIYIGGTSWRVRIPPGGTINDEVVVTDLFALAQAGEYTIRLRRPDTETNQLVTSNTVTLVVAGNSPPDNLRPR